MFYIITNGEFYINKRRAITLRKEDAEKFTNMNAAFNTIKNSISKSMRCYKWRVEEYVCDNEQSDSPVSSAQLTSSNPEPIKYGINDVVLDVDDKNDDMMGMDDYDESNNDYIESQNQFICNKETLNHFKQCIDDLSKDLSKLCNNKDYIREQYSYFDKQISDILHYIELNNFSASEGYKLCKALKNIVLNRRIVKDFLTITTDFTERGLTLKDIMNGHALNMLNGYDNRKYTPRVFTDLFEAKDIDMLLKATEPDNG